MPTTYKGVQMEKEVRSVWIRGPQLRERWGGMSVSTFYDRLKKGAIPKPEYPFGPSTPYWPMASVVAHERAARVPS